MAGQRKGVVIVGATGTIGRTLAQELGESWCVTGTHHARATPHTVHYDLATSDPSALPIDWGAQQAVVIAAGESSVDRCFREPEKTAQANVEGCIRLMRAAAAAGAVPVLLSSDAVFRGQLDNSPNPKREDQVPAPGTEYGRQKLRAEQGQVQGGLTLRLSKVSDGFLDGIASSLREGRAVRAATDQYMSLLSARDVAKVLDWCLGNSETGLFHLAAPPYHSRYQWCCMLATALGLSASAVEACSMDEFDAPGNNEFRARDCSIDGSALASRLPFQLQSGESLIREFAAR